MTHWQKQKLEDRIEEAKLVLFQATKAWSEAHDKLWYDWYLRNRSREDSSENVDDPPPLYYPPGLREAIKRYPEEPKAIAQAYLDAYDAYQQLLQEQNPDLHKT